MIEHPLLLIVLGISLASAIASRIARRRRQPKLAILSDEDLLAALASLQATNPRIAAQPHAPHDRTGSAFVRHGASEMREAFHPKSVRSSTEPDEERRRITVLIIDEIRRRERGREYR